MKIKIILAISFLLNCLPQHLSAQTLSKSDTADVHFLNARKFFIYKVDKGETLFNISQKFKIPQEEILQFNHDIEKTGLKAKMKLWIPAYSWLKKDSALVVKDVDEKPEQNIYLIAIVTNLGLPKIYTQHDTTDNYVDEPLPKEVKDNLEFIEGALRADEILKPQGFKSHIYIIDSENDSLRMINKLRKNKEYNLIITNENGNLLKGISGFSKTKNIKLLSCATNTSELIKENTNAISLVPSSGTQCEQMGEFSGGYFLNSVLISVKTSSSKENERTEFFKSGWKKDNTSPTKQVDLIKSGNTAVADSLDKNKTNIVFIPSSNEDLVSSLLNTLKTKIPDYNLNVVGLPTWQYFETIDQNLIESCNVHLFSSGFIDYNSVEVISFRKYFREKYNMEPSESSYQGYDAMVVAGKSFLKNGFKMIIADKPLHVNGIYSNYNFVSEKPGEAFENQNIHVFQPAKDIAIDLINNH